MERAINVVELQNFPSHCLPTLIDLPPFFLRTNLKLISVCINIYFFVSLSLDLFSSKSAFLHDARYLAAIKNCSGPMVVKHTIFTMHVASLQLGASFNTIFFMHIMSLLLGTLFNMKL